MLYIWWVFLLTFSTTELLHVSLWPWANSSKDALLKDNPRLASSMWTKYNFLLASMWCSNPGFGRVPLSLWVHEYNSHIMSRRQYFTCFSPTSGSYNLSDTTSVIFSEHHESSYIDVLIALFVWGKKIVLWDIFMCLFTRSRYERHLFTSK